MIDRQEFVRKMAFNVLRYSGLPKVLFPAFSGVGAILMLHRVTARKVRLPGYNSHLTIAPSFLDSVLTMLRADGYDVIPIDEVKERTVRPDPGKPFVAITLDDGYRDNLDEALPVFEKHGMPFTIYIAPGLIDRKVALWWDVLEELVSSGNPISFDNGRGTTALECSSPRQMAAAFEALTDHMTKYLREDQQQEFITALASHSGMDVRAHCAKSLMHWHEISTIAGHRLCTIGSHTTHHYNLKRLDREHALDEMIEGKVRLEHELGRKIDHFAYPYGYESAVGEREAELAAQAGFKTAVTTRHGVIHRAHGRHLTALPRISVNGRYQDVSHVRTMLSGLTSVVASKGRRVITV